MQSHLAKNGLNIPNGQPTKVSTFLNSILSILKREMMRMRELVWKQEDAISQDNNQVCSDASCREQFSVQV